MAIVYLFTTTKVALYKRDLLNVICFQENWLVEFGYKSDYIPHNILTDHKRLKDKEAIIIFCEPNAATENDTKDIYYRYHPIRRGTITNVRKDATNSLTLSIKLAKVYSYFGNDVNQTIQDFQSTIDKWEDRPQTRKSERMNRNAKFIRIGTTEPKGDWAEWDSNWHLLVQYLSKRKGLDDALFLRIKREVGRKSLLPDPSLDEFGLPTWAIKGGGTYNWDLEFRAGANASRTSPTVSISEDPVAVLGPFENQSGDGTEARFLLSSKRVHQSDYATVVASVPSPDGAKRAPEFRGIIEINPEWWLIPLILLCVITGSLLMSLDSSLLKSWFGEPRKGVYWDGNISLIVFKALGSLLIALGGYLGFRKLPLKTT